MSPYLLLVPDAGSLGKTAKFAPARARVSTRALLISVAIATIATLVVAGALLLR